ncbi:MAG: hypothetical protein OEM97_01765 [Acidimicrobiia bacterium]|nr:hypothetical protein [Acidimicrobiia bacterium]
MASIRTEVTEITTGLAMLGFRDLDTALNVEPPAIANVTDEHFSRLRSERSAGRHAALFETAWANGEAFARAIDGLRGRPPWVVEWKGPHRPPGYEQIPADLRIDHVYLVSCKYKSNILHNVSPGHLFDRLLAERSRSDDWYLEVAPEAYQELYAACRDHVGDSGLPPDVQNITADARQVLKRRLPRRWPATIKPIYANLAYEVARQSAERWEANLATKAKQEEMVWRLLRFQASPYFVLGAAMDGTPLQYRVATPWDFRERFRLARFGAWPDVAGQPVVKWRAEAVDEMDGRQRSVEGHIEIRWSHGRFGQVPEAKVYLDSPHHEVPGYFQLEL